MKPRSRLTGGLLAGLLTVGVLPAARAHTLQPTRATLVLTDGRYDLAAEVGWQVLLAGATDPDAAHRYLEEQLRTTGPARAAWLGRLRAYFGTKWTLRCDGAAVSLSLHFPALETPGQEQLPVETVPVVEMEGTGALPAGARSCTLGAASALGAVTLAVRRPGVARDERRLLAPGETSPAWDLGGTAASSPGAPPDVPQALHPATVVALWLGPTPLVLALAALLVLWWAGWALGAM